MKKIIGYIGSYILFWIGHAVSIVMNWTDGRFYGTYNYLMGASIKVQDWAGLDEPWKKPEGK